MTYDYTRDGPEMYCAGEEIARMFELEATLAKVRELAARWEHEAHGIAMSNEGATGPTEYANGMSACARQLRAALGKEG